MSRNYLAILADDLPLAAALAGGASAPCCVIEKGQVICADAQAESFGAHAGISQDTALALSDQITLYPRHRQTENGLMQQQADWAYRHSSWVHWTENLLIVEIAGSERLFGSLESLWQRLHHRALKHIGRCRIALGPNPEAAVQLARLHWQTLDRQQACEWLTHIPLHSLPLPAKLRQRLQAMGLNKIQDLLSFSSADLARRFPIELKHYLDQLLGRRADLRPLWQPADQFDSTLYLQQPCHSAPALAFPVKRLLDQLAGFLKTRQWSCLGLHLELVNEDRHTQTLSIKLGQGLHRSDQMLEPLKLHLAKITLSAPTTDIRLHATAFRDWRGETPDLMSPQPRDTQQELLNALRARLGEHALRGLQTQPAWLPEYANQMTEFGSPKAQPEIPCDSIRPTWLLPTPLAIAPHEWSEIEFLRGPERIEAHWWQDQGARRDYHVATKKGALVWLFQDRRTQQWYLHGLFG